MQKGNLAAPVHAANSNFSVKPPGTLTINLEKITKGEWPALFSGNAPVIRVCESCNLLPTF